MPSLAKQAKEKLSALNPIDLTDENGDQCPNLELLISTLNGIPKGFYQISNYDTENCTISFCDDSILTLNTEENEEDGQYYVSFETN